MALTQEQLAARQYRIGASEIATIFGANPYCTPLELWARKTGRLIERSQEESEAIALGNMIEPGLLDWAERLLDDTLVRGIECPLVGTPIVSTLDGFSHRRVKVVEAKTAALVCSSRKILDQWSDEHFPEGYWWQIQTQMVCAGVSEGLLVALVGGRGRKQYHVELDRDAVMTAIESAVEWWDLYIGMDQQPECDLDSGEVYKRIKPTAGADVSLDEADSELVDQALALAEEAKEIERKISELKGQLMHKFGTSTEGRLLDGRLVTFRETNRNGYTVAPGSYRALRLPRSRKAKA